MPTTIHRFSRRAFLGFSLLEKPARGCSEQPVSSLGNSLGGAGKPPVKSCSGERRFVGAPPSEQAGQTREIMSPAAPERSRSSKLSYERQRARAKGAALSPLAFYERKRASTASLSLLKRWLRGFSLSKKRGGKVGARPWLHRFSPQKINAESRRSRIVARTKIGSRSDSYLLGTGARSERLGAGK